MSAGASGRVALITGASRGIGFDLAGSFVDAGYAVVVAARDRERLVEVRERLRERGGEVEAVAVDVSVASDVEALRDAALRRFGTVDVLINNAGVLGPVGVAWENEVEEWQEAIAVNLVGVFLCCRAILPVMIAQHRGKIINVAGKGAAAPWPRFSAYAASKAALVRLTEVLALETAHHNVQVNAMAPGANDTDMFRRTAGVETAMLLHLPARPGGPSRLALFLASDASSHISGKFIHVDQDWASWTAADVAGDRFTLRRVEG